jgi:hypothetical protein
MEGIRLGGPGVRTCRAHPPVLAVRLRVVRPEIQLVQAVSRPRRDFQAAQGLSGSAGTFRPRRDFQAASRFSDGGSLSLRRVVGQSRSQVAQRHLGRDLLTALRAICCVTPRPQKSRAVLCQENRKVFALRVDFEPEIGSPIGRNVPRTRLEPLQDSPEPHFFGVEQPGAVARLEDKRFHVPILVAVPCNFLGTGLQLCDDRPCQ